MDTMLRGVTGMSDLMHAARAEASSVTKKTKGDLVAELDLLLDRLVEAGILQPEETRQLLELYRITYEAGQEKGEPTRAFFDVRSRYDRLAADGSTSPVALVIAGAALGSFDLELEADGTTTVAVYRASYGTQLAAIGASIGVIVGGAIGGVLGGQIGGLLGGIIDDKKGDKKK